MLGVPTIADRVAQTVVAMHLEQRADQRFHPDSYGYRPGKSAREALAACRRRCWKYDWVIDLDVQKFFAELPRDLVVRAVRAVTDARRVLPYVKRWLAAPLEHPDGALEQRTKGTPQGSAVWPIPANLFMHYALDSWMVRNFPRCPFGATPTTPSCTARRAARRSTCSRGSPRGSARSGSVSTRRRRGSSTARTVGAGQSTSTARSPSSATPSGHGGARQERPELNRLLAGDQPPGAQGQGRRAPPDADPPAHRPVAGRPGATAEPHRRQGGSTTTAGTTGPRSTPSSSASTPTRGAGPGGNTSGCGPTSASATGGPRCPPGSPACPSTGARSARTRADQKSPVTGDCHAGICGSRGPQRPRPPDSVRSRRCDNPPSSASIAPTRSRLRVRGCRVLPRKERN
jgi:Reverse transcriptase (RNA-dependent DNA polymerase)